MCGINGFISNGHSASPLHILETMNAAIFHRGPDEDGFFAEDVRGCHVGMAMRRLSIIDLSTGRQPIYTDDRQKAILFNGEIYNFKELKARLEADGVAFQTHSDTEVIVKLYEKYGTDAFAMLDGMFAFSIFDRAKQKVYIARDFFGEKPLYYAKTADRFVWASELKSILKALPQTPEIDRDGLNLFLQLTYIPAPFTIYEGVKKLEANHYIAFDCNDFAFDIHEIRQDFRRYGAMSKTDALDKTRELVRDSVASRSIADVKLGTFLSGGVDSSIVSLCLAQQTEGKIDTFSIGFEKKSFDETDKSRLVAKLIGSNHHEFVISEKDLAENRDAILLNFDEPFADSSALATYVVAHKTRESVTVALTGDGGDEVFGGYNKYYMGKLNEKYARFIPEPLHRRFSKAVETLLRTGDDNRGKRFKASRLLKAINYEGDFYYNIISLGFQENEVRELLRSDFFRESPLQYYKDIIGDNNKTLTDFRNIDRLLSLEGDMLVKVDRTSMLTSLECRAPLLNKEIWNFTSQLPENFLMNGWDKKHILKEAFNSHFPKGFLDKSKSGFGVPVGDWLRSELKAELLSYAERSFVERQGIFNGAVVEKLVAQHIDGKVDNTFRVWTYFCFQKWYTHHHGA
jgi:asparagine synthase (glutamine-hydrolysing)